MPHLNKSLSPTVQQMLGLHTLPIEHLFEEQPTVVDITDEDSFSSS